MHTLFIIGSGALQDAWRPVIEALRETGFRDVRTSDGANFAMSRLVYNMRMHWKLKGDDDDGKELLDKYNGVREKIASKLRDAEARGELRVRAEFEQVSMTFALGVGDTISIATTNWDGAVAAKLQAIADRYSRSVTAKAMHGTSQDSPQPFTRQDPRRRLRRRQSARVGGNARARRAYLS
jgi:hypothetical protein